MKKRLLDRTFPGFPPEPVTNYWPYPKALNGWWHILTPSEQKVLDYILRHTWGYKKTADGISLSQFIKGITKRDGRILDKGTGIKDEKTIRKALRGLERKGFIIIIPQKARENLFQLKITPPQELAPLPKSGASPLPKNDSAFYQKLAPTIKDISIENINTIPSGNDKKVTYKEEIARLISYLSEKLGGVRFPNYGKQARYTKSMLGAGYTVEDICWAIDAMFANKWWQENSFDMKNVADEIPKLMTRTFRIGGKK